MNPLSTPFTSFITYHGQFEHTVMLFGLKCTGSTFKITIAGLLSNHQDSDAGYVDDISVCATTWSDYLKHLGQFLNTILNDTFR